MSSTSRFDVSIDSLRPRSEKEIFELIAAERERLLRERGLAREPKKHFAKPVEHAFSAEERDRVTILFGGLTWKHERVIQAVFEGCGYKCEILPVANVAAFQLGKEYGNNGQCNPTYFTVGNLVQYLQYLESTGKTKEEIINNYVFFTAGSCGPCRFGMYESEYRLALQNAGYDDFRVLLFQQNDGVKAASGEAGLKFSVDFGVGMLNALNLGDVMNEMIFRIRPYEVEKGKTDKVFHEAVDTLCTMLRERPLYELADRSPIARKKLTANKQTTWYKTLNGLGKTWDHFYGDPYRDALLAVREQLGTIEIDRLRIKPIVKIIGEFWAQTTEGDGNFNMFAFLEREGAQVLVEPIATWVMYMMYQVKERWAYRRAIDSPHKSPKWYEVQKHLANELSYRKKWIGMTIGERVYERQYHRVVDTLGEIAHHLIPQRELADLANPFYNQFARGGEGHLEVGKNVYYTTNRLCHMVLALKPFGCMPSTQSDGVQSAVANKYKEMIFLPIETSGEGEVNAHSRVQMALGEAKVKARAEFEEALAKSGQKLEDIRAYVDEHPELRNLFYPVPHTNGVAGVAANFVLHVGELMRKRPLQLRVQREISDVPMSA